MPRKSSKGKRQTPESKPKRLVKRRASSPAASRKASIKKIATEKRLSLALEAARMGIWDYDLATNTIQWSEHVHKLLGLKKDDFDGTLETYMNLVHPDDREHVTKDLDRSLRYKKDYYSEHRVVWPSGLIKWVESIGKVSFDSHGKLLRITGTIQDITNKKEIELDREDWKQRFELISTSAGIVIYDYDIASGNIIWSGNSVHVLGYQPKELGNIDRWVELIHPEDRDGALSLLQEAETEMNTYDVYYRFSKKNGAYCYMHDRGVFIPGHQGKAVRMLGMMNDISDRVLAERTIADNNRFRESIEKAMPDILYVYDVKNNRAIYTNKNLGTHLGYTQADLESMGGDDFFSRIIHPDDLENIPAWSNEAQGIVKETELRILQKDGNYRWLLTRSTPFEYDSVGEVIQIIGIAQDITERKKVMDQLNQSERSYRELFETVTEAIYIQRPDGIFIDVNKGACVIHGYEKHELIGKSPEFLSAEGKNDHESQDHRMKMALEGVPQSFEFWVRKKEGEIFLLEIRLTKGSYFGNDIIIATGRDITQRRNTEEALRDSEQRFRTLQQASFGGIGLHDQGVIIDCNQGLCDITGYEYKELIGLNGLQLIAEEWRPLVVEKIQSGYESPYDVEGLRKDGTRYMLEIHGKNIPYEGRPIRVTEFRDVTERKRNEEKIVEQNTRLLSLTEDLMRKNNQLEEFTQIVSHNLRSPVGNIVTLLNFYEGASSEDEKKEYINLLKESSATTLYMLNDLTEVLRIKQNKNIEKQTVTFESVLAQVKTMLNAKISERGALISHDFSAAPSIHYPVIYLESILLNLMDNALKYAHPDRTPTVHFKSYRNASGSLTMEVSDNGLGLNLERYGHQVFKLRKTFHRHPESRGIGLFMIKNQIEAMGGEITLASKESEGTTFFINFSKHQTDAI